jgi:hypothetical protein
MPGETGRSARSPTSSSMPATKRSATTVRSCPCALLTAIGIGHRRQAEHPRLQRAALRGRDALAEVPREPRRPRHARRETRRQRRSRRAQGRPAGRHDRGAVAAVPVPSHAQRNGARAQGGDARRRSPATSVASSTPTSLPRPSGGSATSSPATRRPPLNSPPGSSRTSPRRSPCSASLPPPAAAPHDQRARATQQRDQATDAGRNALPERGLAPAARLRRPLRDQ